MRAVWLLAPVLSLLVLAAHFLRAGNPVLVVALLAIIVAILALRRAWVARLAQIVLLLGAVEWLATLIDLAGVRMHDGEPVGRLVVILATVGLATAASSLVFLTNPIRARYGLSRRSGAERGNGWLRRP